MNNNKVTLNLNNAILVYKLYCNVLQTHNKYYEIWKRIDHNGVIKELLIRSGKRGSKGVVKQISIPDFTPDKLNKKLITLYTKKKNKGYKDVHLSTILDNSGNVDPKPKKAIKPKKKIGNPILIVDNSSSMLQIVKKNSTFNKKKINKQKTGSVVNNRLIFID